MTFTRLSAVSVRASDIFDSAGAIVGRIQNQIGNYFRLYCDTLFVPAGELDYLYREEYMCGMGLDFSAECDSINKIEQDIVNLPNPTQNLLIFISTAKHSLYYWHEIFLTFSKKSSVCYANDTMEPLPESVHDADAIGWREGTEAARQLGLGGCEYGEYASAMKCAFSINAAIMYYDWDWPCVIDEGFCKKQYRK